MKCIKVIACLVFILSFNAYAAVGCSGDAMADDGEIGRTRAINSIVHAYMNQADQKFDKLDTLINEWFSKDCKLVDGRSKLNFLLSGYLKAFKLESDWNRALERIQALKKAYPNSAYPILAEAKYWVAYAWDARGTGFASTVLPEDFRIFKERLKIAEKILINNKKIASTFPNWYEIMVDIQGGLGNKEEQTKYFIEGTTNFNSFLPLYIMMRNFQEPKWGGSWESVDNYINWASNNAPPSEKQFIYANLYYGVRDNMLEGSSFFKDTHVEWPKLKKAFEDLLKLYPESKSNLIHFADLACEANDKVTYLELRKQTDDAFIQSSWGKYESPSSCDAKFGYVK